MNENIDLTKILKDCPKGWEFYSCVHGKVYFEGFDPECMHVIFKVKNDYSTAVDKDGKYNNIADSECCLFPSREQRDWSKFTAPWYKKEKFDPKTLKPFDKVLVWHYEWVADLFSHCCDNSEYPYECTGGGIFVFAIPYNDETKHLVGTEDQAPDFYRYWED